MSFIAAAIIGGGAAIIGGGLQYLGAKEQTDALENAAQSTENWQKYLVAFEEKKYEEARRFRDLAYDEASIKLETLKGTMPLLREGISKLPESAREFYALAGERGTADIMRNLAPYGLSPESSTVGRAVGGLQEGLSAMEARDLVGQEQFRMNAMLSLLGQTPTGVSPQTGYPDFSGATAAQGNLANLAVGQGAVTGGLYGSYAQTLSQLPLLFAGAGGAGGIPPGATSYGGGSWGRSTPLPITGGSAAQFSFPSGIPPQLRNVI